MYKKMSVLFMRRLIILPTLFQLKRYMQSLQQLQNIYLIIDLKLHHYDLKE